MALVLDQDQQMLKQAAADFVRKESPVSRVRKLRDERDPDGFSRAIWRKMAELGWHGILVPTDCGGLGMGMIELACVLEECGRNLVPEPLLSTLALGTNAILLGGNDAQKSEWLPQVAGGSLLMTVAYQERASRYSTTRVETRAVRRAGGYVLSGEKVLVLDGHAADVFVVSARTSGAVGEMQGVSLFLVRRDVPGLEVIRQSTLDLRGAAVVRLCDVEVSESARVGAEGGGAAVLEAVLDRATVALCAEMLGSMQAAFEMTLEYLKTRKQFGVLIGTFQALKHRAARVFVEIELARSAVLGACDALDRGALEARALVSAAKARCSDAAMLAGYEGVQMHGGIGMTDEHDIGLYLKRARTAEIMFGDAAFHRDRFASLSGF
jgi:alkylation response protein AidB-like acyl-CoA dehydrogenase